jgi:radical SAM superfamily enzyme YgiQ (UPF0313 family)
MLNFIRRVHDLDRIVVVGGPDPTSQPEVYHEADFLVLGEGEITIPMFLNDLQKGAKSGRYFSEEKANMLKAVVPRYDLINFRNYIMIGFQFTRGCPFNCEFCNIIELYGRIPRFKSNEQVIKELQSLYDLGYRGHIDIVDDNFIGNKKKAKDLLRELKKWTKNHRYPFYFATEASINLADDDELLQLMKDVDFRYVFLGIETPENDTLKLNKKTQNVNKPIEDAVRKLLSYGIVSNGGYIIGFDSESKQIADNMIDSIQKSGICMAMISLLYALPNTQLTRRLESEGRLFQQASRSIGKSDIDQTTSGLNFITLISRVEILKNFIRVINGRAFAHVHVDDVQPVVAEVGHLAAVEFQKGAEAEVHPRIPVAIGHRSQETQPVEIGGLLRGFLAQRARHAAVPYGVDVADLPDGSGFHELLERLQVDLAGALLQSDLQDRRSLLRRLPEDAR